LKNNVGYNAKSAEVANLNQSFCDVTFNYFTLPATISATDFVSLDTSQLTAARQTNGDLPYVNFARLASTSDCVNAGTNWNFPFYGAAPDLGAFETGPTNSPNPVISKSGTNLIFTTAGWANQTNYLYVATNLTSAPWLCIATNKSDLNGGSKFTNGSAAGLTQRFYRTGFPHLDFTLSPP
jgi:hypothetical protein